MKNIKNFINIMKHLNVYLNESTEKVKITRDWLIEHYDLFNKMYFNNELPHSSKISLEVIRSKTDELGCQGEYVRSYLSSKAMEDGKYIMFLKPDKVYVGYTSTYKGGRWKWEPIIDNLQRAKSILDFKPFIRINGIYNATLNNFEDTLLHEMVHLWTYKDGLAPKMAHGAEFKKKCKEIKKIAQDKYGKDYELSTRAIRTDEYEYDDKWKAKIRTEINKIKNMGGGAIGVYIIYDEEQIKKTKYKHPERFLFCTKNMLPSIIKEIRDDEIGKNYLKHIYVSENSYEPMCDAYGRFQTVRTYKFWDPTYYKKAKDVMINGAKDILNEQTNESKKQYMKPNMSIITIPAGINLSEINIEDLINAQEDNEQVGTKENEKNLINP